MKHHIRIIHYVLAVLFIAVFSFAFSACTKEEENPEEPVEPSYTVGGSLLFTGRAVHLRKDLHTASLRR